MTFEIVSNNSKITVRQFGRINLFLSRGAKG